MMLKSFNICLIICCLFSMTTLAQKSQILIARNAVGKLQASIGNKEDANKQLGIITEGLKAVDSAAKDNKTKKWTETFAIKSYLTSFAALIDNNPTNSTKFYEAAKEAVKTAESLDKFNDNSGLIKASKHNILIKKQDKATESFFNNDFREAFDDLKEVSNNFPTDTTLALNTAICALNIQLYDEALEYFLRAKQNGIKNPAVFQKMAQLYSVKSSSETAIKTLEDGLALNPYNRYLTNDYINLLLDHEDFAKAKDLIENNLKVEKGNKLLYFLYGYLNQIGGNNPTAILAYDKALNSDQNYFDALYQVSLAYINLANETLNKNTADKETTYSSLINKAQFALQRAYEVNPNDKNTIKLLINIYSKKQATDKVQELNRRLQEM